MRRRDLLTACLTGTSLAAGPGCRRRAPSSRERLRLSVAKRLSASSFYLALELGYFRDAGLDLEVQQSAGAMQAMAAMAGGNIDVLFTAPGTSFLNAVLKGLPLKIVAGREIANPTCGSAGTVYGLRRRFPQGLSDLRVLKGKRVATGPSIGFSVFALDAHLGRVGLSVDDVTRVSLEPQHSVAALLGGSVEAIVLDSELERDLASMAADIVRTASLASVLPNFQYSHIFFGQTLLQADVGIGARFLAAYVRGAREFARGKTPRYMEEYARSNGLDMERVTRACRDTFTVDASVDLESLQMFAEWAARRRYTARPVATSQLVDLRFLEKAHAS